jgi:hypothetical protein
MLLVSAFDSAPLRPPHALRTMARAPIVLAVIDLSCHQPRPLQTAPIARRREPPTHDYSASLPARLHNLGNRALQFPIAPRMD